MAEVLLVVNCQADASYQNRRLLHALYSDRFDMAFSVSPTCPMDENYTNIVSQWQPAPLGPDNRCLCCPPSANDHGIGKHHFHPRLKAVAEAANDYEFVIFTEDDCLLSPRLNPGRVQQLCADHEAVVAGIWLCDPADTTWIWSRFVAPYSEREEVKKYFDCSRMGRNWQRYSGALLPPQSGAPMFAGYSDIFILRTSLLREITADLPITAEMWLEIAIPTMLLHHTGRIGTIKGVALWGEDRNRTPEEAIAMLRTADYVHPVKSSIYPASRIQDAYRAVAVLDQSQ
jgi:hypothetical protein